MNKELKFRTWDGEKMWQCGVTAEGKVYNGVFGSADWPLMQFTGFRDKNGVEVYEGDILANHNSRTNLWEVAFDDDAAFGFFARFIRPNGKGEFRESYLTSSTCFEVIGNIYENPELLEEPLGNATDASGK